MVTRLQSDKKAFVQSPKKAFESESESVQYTASLFIIAIGGLNPWQGVEPGSPCIARVGQIGQPGTAYRWTILVQRADNQPFSREVIKTFVYEQAPSTQQLTTTDWTTGATLACVEGTGADGFYHAPSVPMTNWPLASIYKEQSCHIGCLQHST